MNILVFVGVTFSRTFVRFASCDLLIEQSCIFFLGEYYADHALLEIVCG